MILSDLLDSIVVDDAGAQIGHVIDVRFVVEDAEESTMRARLASLIVSPRSRTSFLGYERSEVTAPLFIARFLRWRHRGSRLIPWADVACLEPGRVRLRPAYRTERLI